MTLVSVTMQPYITFDVGAAELESLTRQGILYTPGTNLYVTWQEYAGGPLTDVNGVTITIRNASNTVVLATTSAGCTRTDVGRWAYHWAVAAEPGPGTYTALWAATDQRGFPAAASETFTI